MKLALGYKVWWTTLFYVRSISNLEEVEVVEYWKEKKA